MDLIIGPRNYYSNGNSRPKMTGAKKSKEFETIVGILDLCLNRTCCKSQSKSQTEDLPFVSSRNLQLYLSKVSFYIT